MLTRFKCGQTYHPLVGVRCVVGSIQQLTVLQLFTQPLQQANGLIENSWHGHSSQVFTCEETKQRALKTATKTLFLRFINSSTE